MYLSPASQRFQHTFFNTWNKQSPRQSLQRNKTVQVSSRAFQTDVSLKIIPRYLPKSPHLSRRVAFVPALRRLPLRPTLRGVNNHVLANESPVSQTSVPVLQPFHRWLVCLPLNSRCQQPHYCQQELHVAYNSPAVQRLHRWFVCLPLLKPKTLRGVNDHILANRSFTSRTFLQRFSVCIVGLSVCLPLSPTLFRGVNNHILANKSSTSRTFLQRFSVSIVGLSVCLPLSPTLFRGVNDHILANKSSTSRTFLQRFSVSMAGFSVCLPLSPALFRGVNNLFLPTRAPRRGYLFQRFSVSIVGFPVCR